MAVLWLGAFVLFSLLYLATAQRGVSWQDSGSLQWRILTGTYADPLGLALVHPLYIAAGQLAAAIPVGRVTARINAFSGLAMAAALANVACIVTLLTGRRWIGLAAAAMLSVCHTVWWLATIAESYTLNVALFSAELWFLVALLRRPRAWLLVGLALACGLDWSVHNMALLGLPVYAAVGGVLIARRRLPAWSVAAALVAFAVGASPYWVLIARQLAAGGDLVATAKSALFGHYRPEVLNVSLHRPMMKINAEIAALNFVSFFPVLAVIGWWGLRRLPNRPTAYALAALTVIEVLFVVRYPITDQFTFLLPSLVLIALAGGLGVAALADASAGWRKAAAVACLLSVACPPALYAAVPRLAAWAGVQPNRPRRLPYRDELRFWLVPWKCHEQSAELFARAVLAEVHPGDVLLLDSTALDTLRVAQKLYGLGQGVVLTDSDEDLLGNYDHGPPSFLRALAGRPLYVLSPVKNYLPDKLLTDAYFVRPPGRVLYRVVWKAEPPASAPGG
ncbi:MAG: DUF2723 domain-containing protein [Phycisphaerae bacterium]|jgi:hypothetical protein